MAQEDIRPALLFVEKERKKRRFRVFFLFIGLLLAISLSFQIGRYSVAPGLVVDILLSKIGLVQPYWDRAVETVVINVRMPRIFVAVLAGGALALSGASYQTLFRNPMVSPDILGVSAGAGFGAALAMLLDFPWWQIQAMALVFGIGAVLAASLIAWLFGKNNMTVMVLSGIVVSSFFGALLSVVKTLVDTENTLPSLVFWLMGSLGRSSTQDLVLMLPALGLSSFLIYIFRYQVNALSAGEQEAASMGVNVPLTKAVIIISSTAMTAVTVCICGIVGWVGMVVPHIARLLVGANFPRLIFTSFCIGSLALLFIDSIIRGVPGAELPLGVLTALLGTPIFVVLLSRARREWN